MERCCGFATVKPQRRIRTNLFAQFLSGANLPGGNVCFDSGAAHRFRNKRECSAYQRDALPHACKSEGHRTLALCWDSDSIVCDIQRDPLPATAQLNLRFVSMTVASNVVQRFLSHAVKAERDLLIHLCWDVLLGEGNLNRCLLSNGFTKVSKCGNET